MINLCKLSSLHAHLQGKCLYILCMCVCAVVQLCPTLYKPMDYSLPGSSVHGTFQARALEWVAIFFSRVKILHMHEFKIFKTASIWVKPTIKCTEKVYDVYQLLKSLCLHLHE